MNIRTATLDDANQIAFVHVESWKTTYKGLVADEFLQRLNVENRTAQWIRNFSSPQKDEVVFVAENPEGKIVAFASGGASREADRGYDAELYAIYLLEKFQGRGLGRQLMRNMAHHLSARQYHSFMAWVLAGNTAYDFYRKMGGEPFAQQEIRIGDELLQEIAVGWKDINRLG